MPSNSDELISIKSLETIKNRFKIPIISIFGDLEFNNQLAIARFISKYCRIVIYTALSLPGKRLCNDKFIYSWVPKDSKHFNNIISLDASNKSSVLYSGSVRPERKGLIDYLIKNNVNLTIAGGERTGNLSVLNYADNIKNSKICLSFSRAGGMHVTNARPFEVLLCGSLLLEQHGKETPKFFTPYEDYVPFYNNKDCLEKIEYLLSNDRERTRIAENGRLKVLEYYSDVRFWSDIENSLSKNISVNRKNIQFNDIKSYWAAPLCTYSYPDFNFNIYNRFKPTFKLYYIVLDKLESHLITYYLLKLFIYLAIFPGRLKNYILRKANC